jgi:cytochrome c-type biogenesis protein CcmH
MSTPRFLPWTVLALVVAAALTVAAWPSHGPPSVAERARSVASELRCVDCEALSIADSSTSNAAAQRADIESRVRAGQSDAQIRRAYVDRYGASILLRPENKGIGMLVWALPVGAFLLGAGGLALALRRWRSEPRLAASTADEQLVRRTREVR